MKQNGEVIIWMKNWWNIYSVADMINFLKRIYVLTKILPRKTHRPFELQNNYKTLDNKMRSS